MSALTVGIHGLTGKEDPMNNRNDRWIEGVVPHIGLTGPELEGASDFFVTGSDSEATAFDREHDLGWSH